MEQPLKTARGRSGSKRPNESRAGERRRPARRPEARAAEGEAPRIDYPPEGESIASDHYTVRITAPEGAAFVDISIDDGPWQACRYAVGHWWFDWTDFEAGDHEIRTRLFNSQGLERNSTRRVHVG